MRPQPPPGDAHGVDAGKDGAPPPGWDAGTPHTAPTGPQTPWGRTQSPPSQVKLRVVLRVPAWARPFPSRPGAEARVRLEHFVPGSRLRSQRAGLCPCCGTNWAALLGAVLGSAPRVIVGPAMGLARAQLPPLLHHQHHWPDAAASGAPRGSPNPARLTPAFGPSTRAAFPGAQGAAVHPHSPKPPSQRHRSPRRCRETSSRRSNLPSKTCLLLSAALFTKTGGERASGKTSGKAAGERCSAQAPLGGGSSLQLPGDVHSSRAQRPHPSRGPAAPNPGHCLPPVQSAQGPQPKQGLLTGVPAAMG